MLKLIIAFSAILVASVCYCSTYGVDVSTVLTLSEVQCLVSDGKIFAVARCWHSTGEVDTNVVATATAAWEGGMSYFDVYFFPCYDCGDAAYAIFQRRFY